MTSVIIENLPPTTAAVLPGWANDIAKVYMKRNLEVWLLRTLIHIKMDSVKLLSPRPRKVN